MKYIVWVGGTGNHFDNLIDAQINKLEWLYKGYDDVIIETINKQIMRGFIIYSTAIIIGIIGIDFMMFCWLDYQITMYIFWIVWYTIFYCITLWKRL